MLRTIALFRRIGHLTCLACSIACAPSMQWASSQPAPEWVERGGSSAEFPPGRFATGFAQMLVSEQALETAKQQATADLARQIRVQIVSSVLDVYREKDGELEEDLFGRIQTTTDLRLDGIRFEIHRERRSVWVLALLERLPAAMASRKRRDGSLALAERCLEGATREEGEGRTSQALAAYRDCLVPIDAAFEHEGVASALSRGRLVDDGGGARLVEISSRVRNRILALPHEDATSIRAAAEGLAVQLARGGVTRGRALQVAPFTLGDRDISSSFGREIAAALESAIAGGDGVSAIATTVTSDDLARDVVVVRGAYRVDGDRIQIRVVAREARTANLLASSEVNLEKRAIPSGIELHPRNLATFLRDAEKLSGGEIVSGDLRIEVRTSKGTNGLVYEEGEELGLYVRVNQPAWVRLIYVLTNGDHVPIDQAWYLDASKVNQLVEYRERFEIVPPFGVEMIHVMASTNRPPLLATRATRIAGQDYLVIAEGAEQIVRYRGIARKKKQQMAEQTLSLTTMRRPGADRQNTQRFPYRR
jgi:hypothetical protein